ncbi:MAG: prephenate dehydrogenase [Clostridia bacterium]
MNIGIIGLGLMGASAAKSVKQKTGHTVYGIDLNKETMFFAKGNGTIDDSLTEENVKDCKLIFIALCPKATIDWVENHCEFISSETVVVDFCGIKRSVVTQIEEIAQKHNFIYVGGHPMAGKEKGGYVSSDENLYVGASMILTPNAGVDIKILAMLNDFFIDMGFANTTISSPEEHDRIIAYTSQLPHIASSAYIKSPTAKKRRGFSAGSFKDLSRVAFMDEKMWTELFLEKPDFLIEELEEYIENLNEYLSALKAKDYELTQNLIHDGKEKKISSGGN